MHALTEFVEILENNENCVVLKVKPNSRVGLICIGYFNGNEELIRLTKGVTQTITVFYEDKTSNSWFWGKDTKLVSDATKKMGTMVQRCLEDDFDICIHGYDEAIRNTCSIRKLGDTTGEEQTYKMVWFDNDHTVAVHKNDCFLRRYDNQDEAKDFIYSMFSRLIYEETSKASTGANVITFKGVRR